MTPIFIEELENAAGGRILTFAPEKPIQYIVKDPGELQENCLYFCSEKEENRDLLKRMIACRAAGVVVRAPCRLDVNQWREAGIGIIEVKTPILFQIALAKLYRTKFDIPFVQVIGSAGKTTTKDMIGAVLNAGMSALVGYKNYNTAFGAACNILTLRDRHRAAVLEAGMKSAGYMGFCSSIIRPDIAVLTSIQHAHYVTMGSIENIIEAKSEMLDYLDENGVLILNGEDENCRRFPADRHRGRVLRYGFSEKYDLWASRIVCRNFRTYFVARGRGFRLSCMIRTVGKYNVGNALAAILVGLELGVRPEDIRRGLANFEPMAGRLKVFRGPCDTVLIDDNFNANPDSMRMLLEEIPKFAENRPVVLVMGDVERPDEAIREYAEKVHFLIGRQMAGVRFNKLIAVGKWAKEYVRGAASEGVPLSRMSYYKTVELAKDDFQDFVIPGSVMIFKASVYVSVRELMRSLGGR